jgi:hypothetical protein
MRNRKRHRPTQHGSVGAMGREVSVRGRTAPPESQGRRLGGLHEDSDPLLGMLIPARRLDPAAQQM